MIDLSQHDLHDFWPSKQSMLGQHLLHMYVLGQAVPVLPIGIGLMMWFGRAAGLKNTVKWVEFHPAGEKNAADGRDLMGPLGKPCFCGFKGNLNDNKGTCRTLVIYIWLYKVVEYPNKDESCFFFRRDLPPTGTDAGVVAPGQRYFSEGLGSVTEVGDLLPCRWTQLQEFICWIILDSVVVALRQQSVSDI